MFLHAFSIRTCILHLTVKFVYYSFVADEDDPKEILHGNIFFILDAVLPFLEVISK